MKTRKVKALAAIALIASAVGANAEPVELKFANPTPPQAPLNTQGIVPWIDEVNKAADGQFEIKLFWGPSLANVANAYDRVINGVADLAWGTFGPISSQFPKSSVLTLPFVARTGEEAAVGLWRLYERGLVADEFTKVKLVGLAPFPGIYLHTKKPIRTMADLRGLKITGEGRIIGRTLEYLGATAVSLPISDLYPALQRGTVDGNAIAWSAVSSYKLYEVTNYHLEVALGNDDGYIVMNKDSSARLPQQGRDLLDRLSGEALTRRLSKAMDGGNAFARQRISAEAGHVIAQLPADEEARWIATVAPVVEDWTKTTPDGAKVLAAYREEIDKIRARR